MYHISFYVPEEYCDQVKEAMFHAGAGNIGNYAKCSWQTKGMGQYMPLQGSNPFKGQQDNIEKTSEFKVEMICDDKFIDNVIRALKKSHPYEEPAYYVIKMK